MAEYRKALIESEKNELIAKAQRQLQEDANDKAERAKEIAAAQMYYSVICTVFEIQQD